jgi:hypothetical protein
LRDMISLRCDLAEAVVVAIPSWIIYWI